MSEHIYVSHVRSSVFSGTSFIILVYRYVHLSFKKAHRHILPFTGYFSNEISDARVNQKRYYPTQTRSSMLFSHRLLRADNMRGSIPFSGSFKRLLGQTCVVVAILVSLKVLQDELSRRFLYRLRFFRKYLPLTIKATPATNDGMFQVNHLGIRQQIQTDSTWYGFRVNISSSTLALRTEQTGLSEKCACQKIGWLPDKRRGKHFFPVSTKNLTDFRKSSSSIGTGWTILAAVDYHGTSAWETGSKKVNFQEVDLRVPEGFWSGCADPFILGHLVVCELFRYKVGVPMHDSKGVIGIGRLQLGPVPYLELEIAIEEIWHLSYPYLYYENDKPYVIPDVNIHRQHLFDGQEVNESIALAPVYECANIPCSLIRNLVPAHEGQFADGNLFESDDSVVFSAFPMGRSSAEEKSCGRHSKTWISEKNKKTSLSGRSTFIKSCFPSPSAAGTPHGSFFPFLGRHAGRTQHYIPLQYNPNYYGQYIDLYHSGTLQYFRTLQLSRSTGYCGTHHISEDPFTKTVLIDAYRCDNMHDAW
jgi:hypothetical protein